MGENVHDERYPPGQWRLAACDDGGSVIELEDHSLWEVRPGHEMFTMHWEPANHITVVPGGVGIDYPYDLINAESGERVPAKHRRSRPGPAPGWVMLD